MAHRLEHQMLLGAGLALIGAAQPGFSERLALSLDGRQRAAVLHGLLQALEFFGQLFERAGARGHRCGSCLDHGLWWWQQGDTLIDIGGTWGRLTGGPQDCMVCFQGFPFGFQLLM